MWICACGLVNYSILGRCSGCGRYTNVQSPYPVIATDKPCHSCDEEIQPGQSYVPTRRGPEHIYCGGRRRRASL